MELKCNLGFCWTLACHSQVCRSCLPFIKSVSVNIQGTEDIALHKDTLQGTEKYVRDLTIK